MSNRPEAKAAEEVRCLELEACGENVCPHTSEQFERIIRAALREHYGPWLRKYEEALTDIASGEIGPNLTKTIIEAMLSRIRAELAALEVEK